MTYKIKQLLKDLEKGEIQFYKVFWLGWLIQAVIAIVMNFTISNSTFQSLVSAGLLGLWFVYLWRCRKNVKSKFTPYLAVLFYLLVNIGYVFILINGL
jgi:hypothetical protein